MEMPNGTMSRPDQISRPATGAKRSGCRNNQPGNWLKPQVTEQN